jgi:nicotinamidase-related amidase
MESRNQSALLVMDVQGGIVKGLGDKAADYITRVESVVAAARASGIPIFFIVVRFRDGYPEVSRKNKMFERISSNPQYTLTENSPDTQPVIAPREKDILVVKKRVSAFAGSDLEMLLRARDIHDLILCGIATSGVVLSTLRQAADRDYGLTVLSDCCADRDDEVHRVLIEKVFPGQANVTGSAQWIQSLS